MTNMPTFKERYAKVAIPALKEFTKRTNPNAIPKVTKVVINVGVGRASRDAKELDAVVSTLERITGQKPVMTKAHKSIATYKIREGMAIGAMVTLRGTRMQQFLDKLVYAALPRVRDFRGITPDAFGTSGIYTLGIKEHLVFPEISGDSIEKIHGLAITIVTTAKNPAEGKLLMTSLGFPFRDTK